MTIHIGAREARSNFAELLGRVYYKGESIIVERSGKPMVAVIPIDLFQQLMTEREMRFQVLERIRTNAPEVPEDEVEQDVAEAVAAARQSKTR